ncbi:hypothetical protein CMQ_3060 [Grosmannia clavigera kw1407]|uniref:BZIP domain-containing protein n=1 Tax=Grosmannia clavigera (strain kw1407 / UAMH 11150) TaxID=655863 RepID=F0XH46_GROCL|nr:uncharacterized protein CMQ_3060 [Grosmannia clavigera kw1407]EFX03131.1 hypothetical protein CMQ_3060 [Grosmannia clavigera kw1407]
MSPGQTVVDSSAAAIATGTTVSATWTPLDAAIAAASSGTAAPPRRSGTWQFMDDDDTDAADRTERRRQQNRRAQRNHRNRVRAYVSSLEQQVVDTIFHDTEANSSFSATATAATAVAAQADVMSSTATHATAFDSFLLSSAATTGATGNLDMFSTPVDYFCAAAATSTTTPMDRITSTATSPTLGGGNYAPPPQQQPSHTQVSQTMSMPDMFAPDGCCCDCGKFASAMLSQAQAHGQPWPASMGMFGGMRDWHGPAMFGHGGHDHGHSHSHCGHGGHGHGSHGDGGGGHCSSLREATTTTASPN